MKLIRIIKTPFGENRYDKYYGRLDLVVKKSEEPLHSVLVFPDGEVETVPDVNTTIEKPMLKNYLSFEILNNKISSNKGLVNYYAHKSKRLNDNPELVTLLRINPEGEAVKKYFDQDKEYQRKIELFQKAIHELERQYQDRSDEEALEKIKVRYADKSKLDFFDSDIGELPSGEQQSLF